MSAEQTGSDRSVQSSYERHRGDGLEPRLALAATERDVRDWVELSLERMVARNLQWRRDLATLTAEVTR